DWFRVVRAAGRLQDRWPLGPIPRVQMDYVLEAESGPNDADPQVLRTLPGLASWGGLFLYKAFLDKEHERLLALLQSPHLTGLVAFDATRSAVGDDGIAA